MPAAPVYVTGTVTEATAYAATSAVLSALKAAALDSEWWTAADDFTDGGNRYLVLKNETGDWFYVVRAFATTGNIQWTAGEAYNSTTKVLTGRFMGSSTGPHTSNIFASLSLDASGRIASCTLTNTSSTEGWQTSSNSGQNSNSLNGQPGRTSPWPSTPTGTIKYAISVTQHMIAVNLNDAQARWLTQMLESSLYSSANDPKPIVGFGHGAENTLGGFSNGVFIVRAPGYTGTNGHNSTSSQLSTYTGCASNYLSSGVPGHGSGGPFTAVDYTSGKASANRLWVVPGGAYVSAQPALSMRGPRGLTRSLISTLIPTSQATGDTIVVNGTQWTWLCNFTTIDGVSRAVWVDTGVSATPSAPTGFTATAGNTEVSLEWVAPASDGGRAITDYVVEYRTTSGPGAWTVFSDGTSTTTSATVTGLTNDTEYDFRVRAVNSAGNGEWSATASATPAIAPTVPDAPTSLTAVQSDGGTFELFWFAPADGGSGITDYAVQYRESDPVGEWVDLTIYIELSGTYFSVDPSAASLSAYTSYDFRVRATNEVGDGAWSDVESITTAPGAPYGLAAVADGATGVLVSWDAPISGGFDGYELQISPQGWNDWSLSWSGTSTSTVVADVADAAYDFRVRAVRDADSAVSAWSDAAGFIPPEA